MQTVPINSTDNYLFFNAFHMKIKKKCGCRDTRRHVYKTQVY